MHLRCRAPHPNVTAGGNCNYPNGLPSTMLQLEFVAFVERMPEVPDEYFYVPCKRKHCKVVSVYKVTLRNQVA